MDFINGGHIVNILFTSVGRRASLVKSFKESLNKLNYDGAIVTTDMNHLASASFLGDFHELVPKCTDPSYINNLKEICLKHQISLLIPLIDSELEIIAKHKVAFEKIGVLCLISSEETCRLSFDKRDTYDFFKRIGVNTPELVSINEVLNDPNASYPYLLKPAAGSRSIGVTKIYNEKELRFFKEYIKDAILQPFITGEEYTMDIFVDFNNKVRCVVPRLRMETRGGEISKGMTVKNNTLMEAGKYVVESLPGACGCITVQCFLTEKNEVVFIEINPRFGGGVPLSIAAGADFPTWSILMPMNKQIPDFFNDWEDGKVMLRYDDAVYTNSGVLS